VTDAASVNCSNDHATFASGKVRGVSLGSTLLLAEYQGCTAESLFHIFDHPIKPLSNQWGTEHKGGYYLSVSPSSISLTPGATREGFVVTLHTPDGTAKTVEPTEVFACEPDRVSFSNGTATAHEAGPAAVSFLYQLPREQHARLQAVCYITVTGEQ
jgi:hypothetical protein